MQELLGKIFNKDSKILKIIVIVVAAILVISIFSAIFGDKNVKKAEKALVSEYTAEYKDDSYTNVKVKASAVGKNKDFHLYCFDMTVTGKYYSDKVKDTFFVIVYVDGSDIYVVREFEYDSSNKKDIKNIALAFLSKG